MKSFVVVILAVALCFAASSAALPTLSEICYEFRSTLRVIKDVCATRANTMTDDLAMKFFNCYDAAPAGGREIYTKCQIETGGNVMNTTAGIKATCQKLYTFPLYAACLSRNFRAAGISTSDAIIKVNECEEQVLGIGQYAQ